MTTTVGQEVASTTLRVGGNPLDPQYVTNLLGVEPDGAFFHGRLSRRRPDGTVAISGTADLESKVGTWTREIDLDKRSLSIEDQLEHWHCFLETRMEAIKTLAREGAEISIDCYMRREMPIIIYFGSSLLKKLNDLSIPIKLTVYATT
jgi:Domain of unknown function (DUF4279)